MKVKHTLNGNVKVTLSADQASRLRSVLLEVDVLKRREHISQETRDEMDELDNMLCDAGIEYIV